MSAKHATVLFAVMLGLFLSADAPSSSTGDPPKHLLTAIYGWGSGIAPSPNPAVATVSKQAQYVSWAYAGISGQDWVAAYNSAGVKTIVYTQFWRNYSTDKPNNWYTDIATGGAHARAEGRDCSGTPVTAGSTSTNNLQYLNDPRTSGSYSLAHADFVVQSRGSEYAAFFADNTGSVGGMIGLPCNYEYNANWIPPTNTVNSQITMSNGKIAQLFLNTINAYWIDNDGANGWSDSTKLSTPANVLGLMCEQCYIQRQHPSQPHKIGLSYNWSDIENAEIAMVQKHKIFWSYTNGDCSSASSAVALDERMYELASFLLTYDPAYAMIQECFTTTPSNFLVMPETQFVPEAPAGTATASVTSYRVTGTNLFARRFAQCYYQADLVGACEVVVNPDDAATYSIPSATYDPYTHSLAFSGGGVLDGGTVSFSGAKRSSLAPLSAEILVSNGP